MDNKEKYHKIFCEMFSLNADFDSTVIKRNETPDWDSVGHMELVNVLEESFGIMLETEDILALSTYSQGIEILKKYGIEM